MWAALMGIKAYFPSVTHMSTDNLQQAIDKTGQNKQEKLVMLDCRPFCEHAVSHIPDSILVDDEAKDAEDVLQQILTEGKEVEKITIVCYCALGYRSSNYAMALINLLKKLKNIPDAQEMKSRKPKVMVYNLEGSLFKWANEGHHMVDCQNRTTVKCHPYNVVFGKLLYSNLHSEVPEHQDVPPAEASPVLTE